MPGRASGARHQTGSNRFKRRVVRYGHFDDEGREYVITRPDTPLPWINYWAPRRISGSSRTPPAAIPSIAMPACAVCRGTAITTRRWIWAAATSTFETTTLASSGARAGSRLRTNSRTTAAATAWVIRSSAPRIRHPRRDDILRAARRKPGVWRSASPTSARRSVGVAVRLDRVLPVGSPGRQHQLPAQLLHGPGRGRRRRHLPQDRVPRAAGPLRLLRLLGVAGRLRHASATTSWVHTGAGPAHRRGERQGHRLGRARLAADGCHHVKLELAPGETKEVIVLLGYQENPKNDKFDPPDRRRSTRSA